MLLPVLRQIEQKALIERSARFLGVLGGAAATLAVYAASIGDRRSAVVGRIFLQQEINAGQFRTFATISARFGPPAMSAFAPLLGEKRTSVRSVPPRGMPHATLVC
jgi:hypothetical protein